MKTERLELQTVATTRALAARLTSFFGPGDVVYCEGPLGVGKTTFIRAFIQNLAPNTRVPSPTFALAITYETNRFPVLHLDLFRLQSKEDVLTLGVEDALPESLLFVEWPEEIRDVFPPTHTLRFYSQPSRHVLWTRHAT